MKKLRPINEALQGCLTEEEKAAGAVVYDGWPFYLHIEPEEQDDGSDETAV